jgi:hypothetical protein
MSFVPLPFLVVPTNAPLFSRYEPAVDEAFIPTYLLLIV